MHFIRMRKISFWFVLPLLSWIASCSLLRDTSNKSSSESASVSKKRQDIVQFAQQHVGAPYKYAGTSPSGFDCSGFTNFVMKKFNVTLSPASTAQATTGREIPLDRVQPGDLVFFSQDNNRISHVALVIKRSREGIFCVHSTTSRGVMIDNISTSTYWKPRIMFARDVIAGR